MNRLQAQGRIQIWKRHEYRDGGNRVLSFYGLIWLECKFISLLD